MKYNSLRGHPAFHKGYGEISDYLLRVSHPSPFTMSVDDICENNVVIISVAGSRYAAYFFIDSDGKLHLDSEGSWEPVDIGDRPRCTYFISISGPSAGAAINAEITRHNNAPPEPFLMGRHGN